MQEHYTSTWRLTSDLKFQNQNISPLKCLRSSKHFNQKLLNFAFFHHHHHRLLEFVIDSVRHSPWRRVFIFTYPANRRRKMFAIVFVSGGKRATLKLMPSAAAIWIMLSLETVNKTISANIFDLKLLEMKVKSHPST